MKRWLGWATLAVVSLLAAALVQLPASIAQRLLAHGLPALQLQQVTGSAWQGSAGQAVWQGNALGPLTWKLSGASLLLLRPKLALTLNGSVVSGQAVITRLVDGSIRVDQAQLRMPGAWLQLIVNQPQLGLRGDLELDIEQARIDPQGWLVALDGNAWWRSAAISGAGVSVLGDLSLHWQTTGEGQILGTLSDAGGPLALSGQVTVANRAYRVRASLAARDGNVQLRQALGFLGQVDSSGTVRMEIFGPLLAIASV